MDISMFSLLFYVLILIYITWYFWHILSIKIGLWPPGPVPLPFVGNAHLLNYAKIHDDFKKLHEKYGSIFTFHGVWNEPVIVISDHQILNKLLVKYGDVSSGKKELQYFIKLRTRPSLIFMDYGERWKQLRKFSSATLRYFGMGKHSIENHITTELSLLTSEIAAQNGKPYNIKMLLHQSVASVIYRLVAGQQLSVDSDTYKHAVLTLVKGFHNPIIAKHSQVLRTFFFLHNFPGYKKSYQTVLKNNLNIRKAMMDVVIEHQKTFNKNDIRDLIDQFLLELEEKNINNTFTLDCLVDLFFDLFGAGNDTSANTIQWCLIAAATDKYAQSKIVSEIQNVIGDSVPQSKHQQFMPYTRAFLQEVYRIVPVAPIVPRKLIKSANIGGYKTPTATQFIINIWGLHHDCNVFPEPDTFNPNRFLDDEGNFVKCDQVIPFSLGPRNCLGQQLATTEVFIFFCGILQKFEVLSDKVIPNFSDGVFNLTYIPPEFELIYKIR